MTELLAPNGKPSNLTPEQYELVRTPEFKAWFGDWEKLALTKINDSGIDEISLKRLEDGVSKVVDSNGEPLPVYHGTPVEPFVVFDGGSFFTDDYMNADGYASGEMVYEVFLNIKQPLIINAKGRKWDNLENEYGSSTRDIVGQLDFEKYDGVIFNNINDNWFDDEMGDTQNVYFSINSEQIKLADGTNTTFDGSNPDIRFDEGGNVLLAPNGNPSNLTPEQYKLVRTLEFKAWFGDWENDPETASKVVDSNGEPLVVYHGTTSEFNVFKKADKFREDWGVRDYGMYFTNSIKTAQFYSLNFQKKKKDYLHFSQELERLENEKKWQEWTKKYKEGKEKFGIYDLQNQFESIKIYECFLSLKNPLIIDGDGQIWFKVLKGVVDKALNSNNDGIIAKDIIEQGKDVQTTFIAFNPNQIKLADGTNTTFDGSNPDIRFEGGGEIKLKLDEKYKKTLNDENNYPFLILNENDEKIGQIDLMYREDLGGYQVYNASVKEKGKGIGKKAYIKLRQLLGKPIISDSSRTEDAENMWKSLEKNNLAFFDENTLKYKMYKKGGRTIAQTPAPKKERIYGSEKNKPESSKDTKSAEKIEFNEKTLETIKNKVAKHNEKNPKKKVTLASAKAVVRRGMGAYSSSHRPTIKGGKPNSRVAWGLARLNAFFYKIINGKSKSGKYNQDDDLINELGYNVNKYAGGGQLELYHGSEKKFKNFKTNLIDRTDYGWGIYFTDSEDVAKYYARRPFDRDIIAEKIIKSKFSIEEKYLLIDTIRFNLLDLEKSKNILDKKYHPLINQIQREVQNKSFVYEANVLNEKWLDWDKKVPVDIKRMFKNIDDKFFKNGETFYNYLTDKLNTQKNASLFLLDKGINGIKYLITNNITDSNIEGYNYVVFDVDDIEIKSISKYADGGDIQAYEEAMGISQFDEGGEAKPKKVYVSIPIKYEYQDILNEKGLWDGTKFQKYQEKTFEDLKNGQLKGVIGVSSSPHNVGEWFVHRDCLIVMKYDEFVKINDFTIIDYDNPEQLMSDDMKLFNRLYAGKRDENTNEIQLKSQRENSLQNILKKFNMPFNIAIRKEPNLLKKQGLYRIQYFLKESYDFIKWILKNNYVINNPKELSEKIIEYHYIDSSNHISTFYGNTEDKTLNAEYILPYVIEGVVLAGNVFKSEQEIYLNNKTLNIPSNSQLFFRKHFYGNEKESKSNFSELINKYKLREKYRIYFVKYKDIEKYSLLASEQRINKAKEKIELEKKELEIKKDKVVNNLLYFFFDKSLNSLKEIIDKEISEYSDSTLFYYDGDEEYKEVYWYGIVLVQLMVNKYIEIIQNNWKKHISSQEVKNITINSFYRFQNDSYNDLKEYFDANKSELEKINDYRNINGGWLSQYRIEYWLKKSVDDYENMPEWIDYKELAKMYLEKMDAQMYRYYTEDEIPLFSKYNDGGETDEDEFTIEELDEDYKQVFQIRAFKNIGGSDFFFSRLNIYPQQNVFTIELPSGEEIGRATLNEKENYLINIRIDENYRRKGLGLNLYNFIEYVTGKKLKPSPIKISQQAKGLWKKRNPEIIFKDGGETDEPTHFWGKEAGGVLIYCSTTDRYLILLRSDWVTEPNTWGIVSGKLDEDEDEIQQAVYREAEEEIGYKLRNLIPTYIFQKPNFKFHNFVSIVNEEFIPELNWENTDYKWVKINELPDNIHFGLKKLLENEDMPKLVKKHRMENEILVIDMNMYRYDTSVNFKNSKEYPLKLNAPINQVKFIEWADENDFEFEKWGDAGMDDVSWGYTFEVPLNNYIEYLKTEKYYTGGELKKGIKTEMEHKETIKKIKTGDYTIKESAELIAKDHLEENDKYYTNLLEMEKQFADGGKIENIKSKKGDIKLSLDEYMYSDDTDVELVPVSELIKFREFDRKKKPKYNLDNSRDNINHLKFMFQKEGVKSPLIIEYCPQDNAVLIIEGNHRLNSAIDLEMEYLPARVVLKKYGNYSPEKLKNTMQVSGVKADEFGYIPSNLKPSQVGIEGTMPLIYREGGIIEGRLHSECGDDGCGRKFQVGEGGHIIEAERDEAVIVADTFDDNEKYTIKGTLSQIASALNVMGGGKNFDKGASITKNGEQIDFPEMQQEAKDTDVDDIIDSGSIIINRRSMADKNTYEVTGTPKQIASAINSIDGNGVVIQEGATITKLT